MRVLSKTNKKFSKVAKNGACPKCVGTSFKAKRSMLSWPRKTRVRCETCGYNMRRG